MRIMVIIFLVMGNARFESSPVGSIFQGVPLASTPGVRKDRVLGTGPWVFHRACSEPYAPL